MPKLVKLTRFDIKTEWDAGTPTNTEELSDVYVNPDNIQIIMVRDYYVPQKDENTYVQKVMIVFGNEMDIFVNETMDEVLVTI